MIMENQKVGLPNTNLRGGEQGQRRDMSEYTDEYQSKALKQHGVASKSMYRMDEGSMVQCDV